MVSRRVRQRRHSGLACRALARFPPHFRDKGSRARRKIKGRGRRLDDRCARPVGGLARGPLDRARRLVLHDRHAGAGAPADPAAPAGCRRRPQYRGLHFRLSRFAARPLRHRTVARGSHPQAPERRLPPGPQRRPRGDRDLGRPACCEFPRRDGRGRVRDLVRQGSRGRSLGRRASARQLHRDLAEGRRARARRRRPRRQSPRPRSTSPTHRSSPSACPFSIHRIPRS